MNEQKAKMIYGDQKRKIKDGKLTLLQLKVPNPKRAFFDRQLDFIFCTQSSRPRFTHF